MPDRDHVTEGGYRRARLAAELLRETLAGLGVPIEDTKGITGRSNLSGDTFVYIGTLSVDSAEKLLAALSGRTVPESAS